MTDKQQENRSGWVSQPRWPTFPYKLDYTPPPSRLQPRQGQLKEIIPVCYEIYERFTPVGPPVYRIHWVPPQSCPHPWWFGPSTGCHRGAGVRQSVLLWQVLIENQTQVASSLNLEALTLCYCAGMVTLDGHKGWDLGRDFSQTDEKSIVKTDVFAHCWHSPVGSPSLSLPK